MIRQNPFSVYDFLGYLIPGSLVIYSFLIIDYFKNNPVFDIYHFMENFSNIKIEGVFFFIIISYTIGHLISFASSITVEKYANSKYNYPSKFLLGVKYDGFWKSSVSLRNKIERLFLTFLIFPSVIFDWFFGSVLGLNIFYTKELDPLLQAIVSSKANCLFKKIVSNNDGLNERYDTNINKYDFHRILSHYAYEYTKNHQAKLSNYVALYGFLRTICLIFNLLAIYFSIHVILFLEFNLSNAFIIFILSSVSYLSFMAFMKFYRRYTLEGFMIMVIDKDLCDNKTI